MVADLALITTCKGRLPHLQKTLPLMVAQPGTECIVVDYGCPQHVGRWVQENYPQATVVSIEDDPGFSLARARNIGARATKLPWLMFIDADIMLTQNFTQVIRPMLTDGVFLMSAGGNIDVYGSVICARERFFALGGYDELIRGWGCEDIDLYTRLQTSGCVRKHFPANLISAIPHDNALRTQYHLVKNRWVQHRINSLYTTAKQDLMSLLPAPPSQDMLKILYAEATKALINADGKVLGPPNTLNLTMPAGSPNLPWFGLKLSRQVTYVLEGDSVPDMESEPPHNMGTA